MGCGCGRKRVKRTDRIKKLTAAKLKARRKKLQATAVIVTSPLTSDSSTCLSCVESKQSSDEKKRGIRVCHKTNRLIRNIVKDPRFACPLGKWSKSK
jgi:hypothetical protein